MVFTADDAAVFLFQLNSTWGGTVVLFTEVDTVVRVVPFGVDRDFSISVFHATGDATGFIPPFSLTVSNTEFFFARIGWVIPDLLADIDLLLKDVVIAVFITTDNAARIMEAWFPLPPWSTSRVADVFHTWISWVVPGFVDFDFNVLVVEATSHSWDTFVIDTAWFVSRSGWVFVLEFHAVAALFLWTAWIVITAVVIAFAIVGWALTFWISWMWGGLESLALVDFTSLGGTSFASLTLVLNAATDDLPAALVLVSETVLWGFTNSTAVREAWSWASPVD